MILADIKTYLQSALTNVNVYVGEKPSNKPTKYVVIQMLDSDRTDCIDIMTLNFECYAESLQKAAELNNTVKHKMLDCVSLSNVSKAKYSGGGQNIDTQTKTYCFESVFNITYYD